jgi:hypothetical protein
MADNRPRNDDDFGYDDDSFDNYKYEDYDDDYSLTGEDEKPLTSVRFEDEKPLAGGGSEGANKSRSMSRRETIRQVAEEQQSGTPRKPGIVTQDTRLASNPYAGRRLSGSKIDPGMGGGRVNRERTPEERIPASGSRPPGKKNNFAMFYIALLVVSIGICLTVILVIASNWDGAIGVLPSLRTNPTATPAPTADPIEHREIRRAQALLITEINYSRGEGEPHTMTLLDINSSPRRAQEYAVPYTGVRLSDRSSQHMSISFNEFQVGNIVDIEYDARNTTRPEITALNRTRSVQFFEQVARTNVQINIETSQITIGNSVWNFIPGQTLVLYNGMEFPISQIRPIDIITVEGYGDTVWRIQLVAAHGFLQIFNTDMISNGIITIVPNTHYVGRPLEEITEDITLPEGTYTVTITGDNIEDFSETVTITQGQTERLDMGEAELSSALLLVTTTPDDATIIINGRVFEYAGFPAQVEFGEVHVRVERQGFLPQEQTFEITGPINSVTFDLIEIQSEHTLVVFTQPINARIYLNNVFIGFSTLTYTVSPGTYSVVARLPGYVDSRFDITVTGRETEDIMKSLILLPETRDPFENLPPFDADPIPSPSPTPTPLPTNTPNNNGQPNDDNNSDAWWNVPPPTW